MAVKKLGMLHLKTMMEDDKLLTTDYEIISELTTFAQKGIHLRQKKGVMMTWQCVLLYSLG